MHVREGDVAESPHAAYDAHIQRERRRRARVRTTLRLLGLILGSLVVLCLGALTVGHILDADEPRMWGTFTEERCEERTRYGRRSVGTWVSDDRSIVLHDVYLNGGLNVNGKGRASYLIGGMTGGSDVVNDPFFTDAGPWIVGSATVGIALALISRVTAPGDFRQRRSRRPPPRPGSRRSRRLGVRAE